MGLVAAAGWWVFATTRIQHAVNDFARTGAPFGGTVTLDRGVHTFWIEGDCLSCVGNHAAEYRAAASVSVVAPDGQPVRLVDGPDRVFNTGGTEGRSLWVFDAPEAGDFRISLSFDTSGAWDNRLPGNVAIGRGSGLPVRIVRPMVAMVAGSAAVAIVWAVIVRRARERWFHEQATAGGSRRG